MLSLPVYLDNHSTTRVDPRVVEAMLPYFTEKYGNAASVNHSFGIEASDAVEAARAQIASLLNCDARSLIFTSGATEANNLAIKGAMRAARKKKHLVTTAAEHRSVLDPARKLSREGYDVTIVPVDEFGAVDVQRVADAMRDDTVLCSVILANNEVGTINSLDEIGSLCRGRNVLLHTDAVQAVGKIAINLETLPVDLLSLTAHKLYGPKGVGALFVRRDRGRIEIEPLLDGGGHERRLRSGTLPVPLIVGFGEACRIATGCMARESHTIRQLRDRLWDGLRTQLDGLILNGAPENRLAGNLNVSFEGVDGEALMVALRDLAVSSGSACTSADPEPSHVLTAMGRGDRLTRASLRFGIGRFNTAAEIDFAIQSVVSAVNTLRSGRSGATAPGDN